MLLTILAVLSVFAVSTSAQIVSNCPNPCPSQWFNLRNSCYFYGRQQLNFTDAQQFCDQNNATLVEFRDADDFQSVQKHMNINRATWIGLFVPLGSSKPQWIESLSTLDTDKLPWLVGGPTHGYRRRPSWYGAQANSRVVRNNCVAYFKREHIDGYVHFFPCSYKQRFVCVKLE